MAFFYHPHHIIPFAFDIRSVGMHLGVKATASKDFLHFGNFIGNRHTTSDGNNAEIHDDIEFSHEASVLDWL